MLNLAPKTCNSPSIALLFLHCSFIFFPFLGGKKDKIFPYLIGPKRNFGIAKSKAQKKKESI